MSTSKHLGWAHPCNLCTGAEHSRATSALGLGAPLPRSAPGLQMTLRSKHLAALDSTVAGDSDVKLIFGDSTMQASLLGTARKNLAFFQPSSHLVRNVRIVPRNMVQDLRGFRLCVGLAECRARRAQNLLPSRRLATRARVSRRNKPKTPIPIDSIRAAQCLGFKRVAATRFWPTHHDACAPVPEQFTRDYDPGELGDSEGWCAEQCSSDMILASAMPLATTFAGSA